MSELGELEVHAPADLPVLGRGTALDRPESASMCVEISVLISCLKLLR